MAVTFYMIDRVDRRIASLQKEISELGKLIERNNEKQNYVAINRALANANVFLKTKSRKTRNEMYHGVINDLVAAEITLKADIGNDLDRNKLKEAGHLIDCAILLDSISAYCAVKYGRDDDAVLRLDMNISGLKPHVKRLVQSLVGKQAALYFHKSVSDDHLDRYIQIRKWLDGEDNVWERVAKEARKGFWNDNSVRRLYREARRFLYTWPKLRKDPFYIQNIPRAEARHREFPALGGLCAADRIAGQTISRLQSDFRIGRGRALPTTTTMCSSSTKIPSQGWSA